VAREGVTILGATGYTGRLCAAEAVRRGLHVRLAGRSRESLSALASDLGGAALAVADVDEPASLARVAEMSGVLLTTVGPYTRLGRPVLEAALAGGCDYVDVSGEVDFLAWAHDQGARARDAGIALCPGFGIQGFADVLAALAAARAGSEHPPQMARIAYLSHRLRPSTGTMRSVVAVAAGGGRAWRDGSVVAEPVGADRWEVPFPEPLGRRQAVSVPLPEVVTVGRSTGARLVRTYSVVPAGAVLAPLVRPVAAFVGAAARTPAAGLLHAAAGWLPAGPSPEARSRNRVVTIAAVEGEGGSAAAWARFADTYASTARIAVAVAERLWTQGRPAAGALTPSMALLGGAEDFLAEIGAAWSYL
jgi:short subunit dehydrogenase-like uncharacterized protein